MSEKDEAVGTVRIARLGFLLVIRILLSCVELPARPAGRPDVASIGELYACD
jgi:hypothetical protein